MQVYNYTIADHWLSPIINGDYTELDDDEVQTLDDFLADLPPYAQNGVWDVVSEDGHFAQDEISNAFANCFDCTLTLIKD